MKHNTPEIAAAVNAALTEGPTPPESKATDLAEWEKKFEDAFPEGWDHGAMPEDPKAIAGIFSNWAILALMHRFHLSKERFEADYFRVALANWELLSGWRAFWKMDSDDGWPKRYLDSGLEPKPPTGGPK